MYYVISKVLYVHKEKIIIHLLFIIKLELI